LLCPSQQAEPGAAVPPKDWRGDDADADAERRFTTLGLDRDRPFRRAPRIR
jgi:hypothetical protein